MAVRLSADTFEHSLGFLEDFAKAAVKAPQNSIPMIVGGAVGGLTYLNNKREGEDTLPSLSSALVAGGLAGLATNAAMHHFDLPSRGPTPHIPNAAPQSTPPPTVPNPSTPPVPTVHNPVPATPAAQSSAAPVANKASTPPASTLNSSQARQEAVAATPIPDKPYEGVDIPRGNPQQEIVGGKSLVKHQEGGVTYVEEGTVPAHLKGKPTLPSNEELAADEAIAREEASNVQSVVEGTSEKRARDAERAAQEKEDAEWDAQHPESAARLKEVEEKARARQLKYAMEAAELEREVAARQEAKRVDALKSSPINAEAKALQITDL